VSLSLVGDIGGTNARFALWRDGRLDSVRVLSTAAFAGPEQAIRSYLEAIGQRAGDLLRVCLACAGPVSGDAFRFTNNHWVISRASFCRELGLRDLLLINDFSAMALGVTGLREDELLSLRPGVVVADCPRLVLGPGTGLGVGTLLPDPRGGWHALAGEGGHVDLPIGSEREAALWSLLHRQLGHVSAENLLSGSGLLSLYRASCTLDGETAHFLSAAEVTQAALGGDAQATRVLEQFCSSLGRVAGNAALTLGARGGVYLAGGMLPRFADFLLASGFIPAFLDKGEMSGYLRPIPVWLVTAEQPGLLGAGLALQRTATGDPLHTRMLADDA
jgi:glucokinase